MVANSGAFSNLNPNLKNITDVHLSLQDLTVKFDLCFTFKDTYTYISFFKATLKK